MKKTVTKNELGTHLRASYQKLSVYYNEMSKFTDPLQGESVTTATLKIFCVAPCPLSPTLEHSSVGLDKYAYSKVVCNVAAFIC